MVVEGPKAVRFAAKHDVHQGPDHGYPGARLPLAVSVEVVALDLVDQFEWVVAIFATPLAEGELAEGKLAEGSGFAAQTSQVALWRRHLAGLL